MASSIMARICSRAGNRGRFNWVLIHFPKLYRGLGVQRASRLVHRGMIGSVTRTGRIVRHRSPHTRAGVAH